ncbi:MAG: hypothetical protein EOP47_27495 [Sphingobacteriaceae bacterium]|nr:MAG: hypothetical protein EOP47_27495 [Sphingobacteriaceae bacterium]
MNYNVTKEETKKRGKHFSMRNIRLKKTNKKGEKQMLTLAEIQEYYEELKKEGLDGYKVQIIAKTATKAFKTIKVSGVLDITYGNQYSETGDWDNTNFNTALRTFSFCDFLVYSDIKKKKDEL